MKKLTLILLFTIIVCALNAQSISGRVVDQENRPIEFATIVLQTIDSTYIEAAYSDSLGEFRFKNNPDKYRLVAQHIMYDLIDKEFASSDAGTIEMKSKDHNLAEVVVRGERPLVKVINGKLTYDMPQLLQNKMATNVYDALLELPGVYEQSGAITLAGSNGVNVIVNGKLSTMTGDQLIALLKGMPKERISSAEIMYSAPPQYHVRGAVINLILTGNLSEKPHLQGQVNAGYSQYHYADYEGGVTAMYSTPKFSTDFMYQFGYRNHRSAMDLNSLHLFDNTLHNIEQYNRGYSTNSAHNIRLGNDYYFDKSNKLSLAYTAQIMPWVRASETSKGTFSDSENKKQTDKPIQMHNVALDYTSGFGLSIGVDYTHYSSHITQNYKEMMTGKANAFNAKSKQDINRLSLYADQSHDLANDWTLEYGTKFSYASDKSSQTYHSPTSSDLTAPDTQSSLSEYTSELYAGFSKEFSEKLSLKAYLTGEYYKHKEKDYWSLFPQLELSYVISPKHIFQYALSSDKNYPSYWEMVNSVSYMNGYTEIHGNPGLKPYRSYAMQLSYILNSKYICTLYASYQNDYFVQLPYQSSDRLALIYKTTNFDYTEKAGLNVVIPFRCGSFIDSRLTLNGFYDRAKSSNFNHLSFDKDNFGVFSVLKNTFNISSKPNIKAELSGTATSKNIQGPSTISSMYRVDAGVKWISDDNKSEIRLKVNDMFNSWSPKDWRMRFANQNINMHIIPDSRYVSLSFTYKFGGYKENKRKEVDTSRFKK